MEVTLSSEVVRTSEAAVMADDVAVTAVGKNNRWGLITALSRSEREREKSLNLAAVVALSNIAFR